VVWLDLGKNGNDVTRRRKFPQNVSHIQQQIQN
jgi:hypothetical protein